MKFFEVMTGSLPTPYRVEYPYGLPGDGFRQNAPDNKSTCVAYYQAVETRLLEQLPAGNELRHDTAELVADMQQNGWKYPPGSGQDILVYVDANGRPKIAEGNHRLAAALQVGLPAVPVQVKYFGRSDEQHLLWPFDYRDPKIRVISEAAGQTELPPQVAQAFTAMGDQQRGEPEQVMAQAQRVMMGGNFGSVIEHVGDITNRMTRVGRLEFWGLEEAALKIERGYRWLSSGYGFDREFEEGLKHCAEYRKMSLEQLRPQIDQILRRYAQAHMQLPVYNSAQYKAREAAVCLGKQMFTTAHMYLTDLYLKSKGDFAAWKAYAQEYRLDANGNPLQYPYPRGRGPTGV